MANILTKAKEIAEKSRLGTSRDVLDMLIDQAFDCLSLMQSPNGYKNIYINQSLVRGEYAKHDELRELFNVYVEEIRTSAPFEDVLGVAYSSLCGDKLAQYLTPPIVAHSLTSLIDVDARTQAVKLIDNCCGAGALLLGSIRAQYIKHGKTGVAGLCAYASDVDVNMCKLTAVQIAFSCIVHKIPILLIHVQHMDAIHMHRLGSDDNYNVVFNAQNG